MARIALVDKCYFILDAAWGDTYEDAIRCLREHLTDTTYTIDITERCLDNMCEWYDAREDLLHVSDCSFTEGGELDLRLYEVYTDGNIASNLLTLKEASLLRAQYAAAGCDNVTLEEW